MVPSMPLRPHQTRRGPDRREAALRLTLVCAAGALGALLPTALHGGLAARRSPAFAFVAGGGPAGASRRKTRTTTGLARRAAEESVGLEMYEAANADEEESYAMRLRVDDLQIGQELVGIINGVAPFGAFVDVGADRDGLVHISRMSDGYVEDVESLVQPGQTVKVWVTGISKEGRLELTMIEGVTGDGSAMDLSGFEGLPPDQWLEGKVMDITDFGLFVAVAPPGGGPVQKGLVHISQIKDSEDGFVEHPAHEASVGQAVRVRALDTNNGKLRLSMKEHRADEPVASARSRPRAEDLMAFQDMDDTEWIEGRIQRLAKFGCFVEVMPPSGGNKVLGLVHITEIRDGFVDDVEQEVEVGQDVKVRVAQVDVEGGRLSLSMKPPQEA